jgi:hypothetical protein
MVQFVELPFNRMSSVRPCFGRKYAYSQQVGFDVLYYFTNFNSFTFFSINSTHFKVAGQR